MDLKPQIINQKQKAQGKASYSLPSSLTTPVKLLSSISPRLALPLALKYFFTPVKFPVPERERRFIQNSNAITWHLKTKDGNNFTAYEWKGSGQKVLLVHGWSGRGTQFSRMIEELVKKDYHVFTFTAPAHGDSLQKRTHLFEFVDAIAVMVARFGQFPVAVGHSLGGMAIFNALEQNLGAQKVVVIGSPANIRNVITDFCIKIRAAEKVGHLILEHIENRYSMKVEQASSDTLAGKYNPKGLIIHDIEDLDVDISNAVQLDKKWPNASLVVTKGFGHRKILMDMKVIDSIIGYTPLD